MFPKDQPGYWLWTALLSGSLCLFLAHYWGKAFLFAAVCLAAYNAFRAWLLSRQLSRSGAALTMRRHPDTEEDGHG